MAEITPSYGDTLVVEGECGQVYHQYTLRGELRLPADKTVAELQVFLEDVTAADDLAVVVEKTTPLTFRFG